MLIRVMYSYARSYRAGVRRAYGQAPAEETNPELNQGKP
jgi:hypothetical protein